MGNLKLNESFEYAKSAGKKVMKRELASELWPDSRDKTANANISNLCNGKTKKIDIDAVPVICERLGVTADYLFGLSPLQTRDMEVKELRDKMMEIQGRLASIASETRSKVEEIAKTI